MKATRSPHGGGSKGFAPEEERERLVDAFTKVAAAQGYAQTSAGDVAAQAQLPLASFHEHFRDLRQCLLVAYDTFFDRLIEEVEDSMDREATWPQQVESGVGAAVEYVFERAGIARLFAVEAFAAGPPVIERYSAAIERLVELLRLGRRGSQGAGALPVLTEPVLAAGAASLITAALLAEEQARLPELKSHLTEALLVPYRAPVGEPGFST